jgi:hypothetical protein
MTRGSRGAGPACSALIHDFRVTNVSRLRPGRYEKRAIWRILFIASSAATL